MSAAIGVPIALLYMVDEDDLVALRARLTAYSLQVIPVGSLDEGRRALVEHDFDCAFVEVSADEEAGLSIIRDLKSMAGQMPIVVISSNYDLASRVAGRDAGASHYLSAPVPNIDLEMSVVEICKRVQDSRAEPPGVVAIEQVPLPEPVIAEDQDHGLELENRQLRQEAADLRERLMAVEQEAKEARRRAADAQERLQHAEALEGPRAAGAEEDRDWEREVPSIAGGHPPEIDELTGLIGAGPLQDHLDREYARARRYGHALSVLMLDVDRLGRYDRSYGEEAGDRVLRLVADVLRSALRSPDIAARVGGDDFVILATDTTEEQAYLLAERLREALRREARHASQPPVTVSIGIAGSRRLDVKRAEDLLVVAQHAVSQAKGAGRDQSVIAPA